MKNAALRDALISWCRVALALLGSDKIATPTNLPRTIPRDLGSRSRGDLQQLFRSSAQWSMLVYANLEQLEQTPEFCEAAKQLTADEMIAAHLGVVAGSSMERQTLDSTGYLVAVISDYLWRRDSFQFEAAAFDVLCSDIERFFYGTTLPYRFLCPVDGLETDTDRIEFGSRLAIVRMTESEVLEFTTPGYWTITPKKFAVEWTVDLPKVVGDKVPPRAYVNPERKARELFGGVVSVLRLAKIGIVTIDAVRWWNTAWKPFSSYGGTSSLHAPRHLSGNYELKADEVPEVLRLWRAYTATTEVGRRRTELAIRRFNFGYERARAEDKLVDYMIAFEALLLNETAELKFRLATRGATLLGSTPDERRQIYVELAGAYNARSTIVHGSEASTFKLEGARVTIHELVTTVEKRLRAALTEFLHRGSTSSEEQIVREIDDRLIGGCHEATVGL